MRLPIDTDTSANLDAPVVSEVSVDRRQVLHAPGRSMEGSAALPELIDIGTLAGILGVTPRHVRRLVTERRIPYVKVGYFIRFDPAAIRRWLGERTVETRDRSVRQVS
jgi:excisionase family DNA binding protein